jgi:hypothetical protein
MRFAIVDGARLEEAAAAFDHDADRHRGKAERGGEAGEAADLAGAPAVALVGALRLAKL